MSSRASPIETSLKKGAEAGRAAAEFGELLKGQIDILEYLGDERGQGSPMIPPPSAVLHHQPPPPPSSIATPLTVEAKPQTSSSTQQGSVPSSSARASNGHHFGNRLPDSPPETDSAAGSAGSPSSASENSPCSPEFSKAKNGAVFPAAGAQSSVIRHPGGVLLDPTLAQLAQQNELAMAQQRLGFPLPSSGGDPNSFYPPAPAPAQQTSSGPGAQVSPTYILPASDAGLYNGEGPGSRKRLRSDSATPAALKSPRGSVDEAMYEMEGYAQQCIRFSEFSKESWQPLCDETGRELQPLGFHVVADKGFNFSAFDGTFVNQKKNHFQISVHIEAHDPCPPKFVRCGGELKMIKEFRLDFYGVKAEMTSSTVQIKQSQTDRKPVPYCPVVLDLPPSRVTKVTVARLHFSETTMNNQRKNGRPNPDQKFFQLAVALNAMLTNGEEALICSHASEKVIVRASNPGQFDNGESDVTWQKGSASGSIYHPGPVAVGTDRTDPHAALTVGGNLTCTGQLLHPSDRKFKQNIEEVNSATALARLSQIQIVRYEIRPEVAEKWGLTEEERQRVGVIAQELEKIIPDAVREVSDGEGDEFLQVDDSRLFYESAAAVKELCRLTGNLEYKIDEVERISKKLSKISKLKRLDSLRSTTSLASKDSSGIASSYMSSSRSTLPNPDPSRRHHSRSRHSHCNHYCSRHPQGICSNKVIQSTIVVLVMVMALCLIAMASLYILDWHHRSRHPAYPYHATPPFHPTDTNLNISRPHGIPPGQMFIPNQESADSGHRFFWAPEWPGGTPPPELQPCQSLQCEQFCCPNVLSSLVGREYKEGEDVYHLQLLTDPKDPVGHDFADNKTPKESKTAAAKARRRRAIKAKGGQGKEATTAAPESTTTANSQTPPPLGSQLGGASISIVGQNLSLDSRYCIRGSCRSLERNFTIYVPVSPAMPLLPLSVRFAVDSPSLERVELCGPDYEDPDALCPGAAPHFALPESEKETPSESRRSEVLEVGEMEFQLPVGLFMGSAYRFRLGASANLCAPDASADSFSEYTLVFYRTCRP